MMVATVVRADDAPTRTQDVIYGRSYGTVLTFDVFTPKTNANGLGVVVAVSGGWVSNHDSIGSPFFAPFVEALTSDGYTVFAVVHGSQPKYTIPEILPMMSRAVRFIRYHAKDYHVDPNRLGITGGSAGGHLSLMQGCAPVPPDPKSPDPVDHVSAAVQAVGAFFPPTDFLNWGRADHDALGRNELGWLKAPFAFQELDPKTKAFVAITDEAKILEIGRQISPIYHVSAKCPPTLILHGDKDPLVPLQQSQVMVEALKKAGVTARLVVKPNGGHGWAHFEQDVGVVAKWFDEHLKGAAATKSAQ